MPILRQDCLQTCVRIREDTSMKNPVLEYFRSRNAVGRQVRDDGSGKYLLRRFSYGFFTLPSPINLEDLLDSSLFINEDIDVFCDANVFAAPRLSLAQGLLGRRSVFVVPEVAYELIDLRNRPTRAPGTKALLDLLFDQGVFRTVIKVFDYNGLTSYVNAIEYYVNLLHLRKTALEPFVRDFVKRHGREPVGSERAKLYSRIPRSARAARLANKGDPTRRFSDEVTVVAAVIHSLVNRRDVVLLSFDADVFDQFYKLTSLLRDDYASYRLANDYIANPDRYGAKYSLADYADLDPLLRDKHLSFVVERPHDLDYLIPERLTTRGMYVVAPESGGSVMSWVGIEEMRELLAIKAVTLGRNTVQHGDRNAYINLKPCTQKVQLPKKKNYAFFLNDQTLRAIRKNPKPGEAKEIHISLADYMRAIDDIETPRSASK